MTIKLGNNEIPETASEQLATDLLDMAEGLTPSKYPDAPSAITALFDVVKCLAKATAMILVTTSQKQIRASDDFIGWLFKNPSTRKWAFNAFLIFAVYYFRGGNTSDVDKAKLREVVGEIVSAAAHTNVVQVKP